MATLPTITDDHFDGGKNLDRGTTTYGNNDLATIIQAAEVDIDAIETRLTSAEAHEADHIQGGGQEVDGDLLDIDFTPSNYTPTVTAPATDADHLTAHLSGVDVEMVNMGQNLGVASSATLIQAGQPVATETLTVGADTYEADGAGANINFVIAGTAEGTLDNLLAAAAASGTENLFWEKLNATTLQISAADAPQGNISGLNPSIALDASSLTNYSWNVGDVNLNTLGGDASGQQEYGVSSIAVTAAMISAGYVRFSYPFTVREWVSNVMTSAGITRLTQNDTFVVSGNDIVVTLNGGGAPDIQATDVIRIVAYA